MQQLLCAEKLLRAVSCNAARRYVEIFHWKRVTFTQTTTYFRLIELFYKELHLGELHFHQTGIQKQFQPTATSNVLLSKLGRKIRLFFSLEKYRETHAMSRACEQSRTKITAR